jgi:class 3 adenylate cyclase
MGCSKCGTESLPGKRFCAECGSPLPIRCSKCGADTSANAKFCADCGAALASITQPRSDSSAIGSATTKEIRVTPEQGEAARAIDGERKTVTALFADIKGSMELMEDLDPEEARAIVDPALKLMINAVHRYGGYVVQSTGDGIFALFGAPVAYEDHPQRALYAALRMHEAMRQYGERLRTDKGLNLQLRIGVNIGEVVVRNIDTGTEHAEYSPIGHSTSLAARLQTLATPGSTIIGENMRALVEGYFQLKGLGLTRIKGVSEPVELFEVTGLGPLRTRLQRAAGRGLTKFVGRQCEMEALRHAAALARQGRGQIVAAMADPGVGKSRLFYEFKATNASDWTLLEALSISHGKASAYLPVLDLLRNYFDISPPDDERKRREKVAGKITMLDRSLEDDLPYIFSLLSIVEGDDPLAQTDGRIKKRRTLEAIKRILLRESLNQPLILIFEDLHWMDGESEALLNLLADSIATSRVLLLVNYRPEYHHQWGSKTYYTQLRLDPLGKESAQEMLSTLVGADASLDPLKRLILEKTEGNPLFMEEIVLSLFDDRTLIRNGEVKLARPLASLRIPTTIQGILASRIDRLPADEKDLLQTVAVIGTEFTLGVTRAVSGKSDDDLDRMLSALQLVEFIYEQPAANDVEYTFKHALTHGVAYNSLLAERRKLLHERTGQSIEELYTDRLEDHLTELAYHFDLGGNLPKAVEYHGRAGTKAAQQVAHYEAIGYFTRTLELLRLLPEGAARDRHELDLQMGLSWSSFMAKGSAPELESALFRACELGEQLGENAKLMEALITLAHYKRLDFGLARELAERVLAMAQTAKALAMLAGAHFVLGLVGFGTGQFPEAREHFEHAVELFSTTQVHNHLAYFAQAAPNTLVAALVVLGYPSTALRKADEWVAEACRHADPYSIATALFLNGAHHLVLRDAGMVSKRADEIFSIASAHSMPMNLIAATFFRGWALAVAGRGDEGIAEMRRSISDPRLAGAMGPAGLRTILAETCGKNRRVDEGLDLVAEGLAMAEQTGQRVVEAELHRLKGELLMIKAPGNMVEVEHCLRTAIDVARRQEARLFELRATVSLARLMANRGHRDEARAMLTDIYNWFTEGFDIADLKEAKALLDELAA